MPFVIDRRTAALAIAGLVVPRPRIARAAAEADRFSSLEAESGARIGVTAVDTGHGAVVAHRAEEPFPLCSTFKLLAVMAILTRQAAEPTTLAQRLSFGRSDLVSSSPITSQHIETGMTVAEVCAAALQYSDNTAANLLIKLIGGPPAVTAFARTIGDPVFRLDRWETALNSAIPGDPRDTSSPQAMMDDLRRAILGPVLGAAEREQLATWMKGCTTGTNRIRSVAPAGSVVADKTGTGDNGTANDIAVIWPPGRAPIVVAVYVTGLKTGTADGTVAAAAKLALDGLRA